ncbi:alpha/beta-hydrolase [Sporormia fimetaria CBS 119925]|uniref:Alpha/beta-hydrolase n=1 Tax=Sporormia fimetaria CBS 119925 TaxID=1340428 RepID=A0A6A6VRM3_9PLEO|nr:alpha/beta-hydrolase [Sporormia fimetaria CBS 119925]
MATWVRLVIFSVLAAFSFAAPTLEKRSIDAELLSSFNLMSQYASAAYCPKNYNSPGDKVSCAAERCLQIQAANTTTLVEFNSDLDTDVTGYVATDDTNRLIIVSFRGSHSLDNWITNLQLDLVQTDLCAGCTAHRGFWQSWLDSRKDVMGAIKRAVQTRPGYQIVATGHSLGGSIATLAAAQLRRDGYKVTLYSFGAPRIGGPKLSDFITRQTGGNYRVTHWNDPVPRLPPLPFGYVHISPEYYINRGNRLSVAPSHVKIYPGSINLEGNAAWIATDIGAHLWYFFGITDACK